MTEIQRTALELFTRKNADYGDAFAKYGMPDNKDRETWALIRSHVEDEEHDFVPWYTYYPEPIRKD